MEKEIVEISFIDANGNPQTRFVGQWIDKIVYHPDGIYWDIHFHNGDVETIFKPTRILKR